MKRFLKQIYRRLLPWMNRLPFYNRLRLRRNKLLMKEAVLQSCTIDCHGVGNVIHIAKNARLSACYIRIYGNNNEVTIGEEVLMKNCTMVLEDDGNAVTIGARSRLTGATHFACIEGTRISVGEDCLFSYEITMRTGDGHSVTDLDGNRINPSADIYIGDRVWIGHKATLGKGAAIAPDSIVATAAVVTKRFECPHCVVAGVPAAVVKENISWDFRRL